MSAVRVYKNPFPTAEILKEQWQSIRVMEVRLIASFPKPQIVGGLTNWIEANCEGQFFIGVWYQFYRKADDGCVEIYFEDPASAFNCKMNWC
jgi:hypothetical protein